MKSHHHSNNSEDARRFFHAIELGSIIALALGLALCTDSWGQTQKTPDAPQAKRHAYWNHNEKAAWVNAFAGKTMDVAYTCQLMSGPIAGPSGQLYNFREATTRARTCRGVAMTQGAILGGMLLSSYAFHKAGWHRVESLPVWAAGALGWTGYATNRARRSGLK